MKVYVESKEQILEKRADSRGTPPIILSSVDLTDEEDQRVIEAYKHLEPYEDLGYFGQFRNAGHELYILSDSNQDKLDEHGGDRQNITAQPDPMSQSATQHKASYAREGAISQYRLSKVKSSIRRTATPAYNPFSLLGRKLLAPPDELNPPTAI